MIKADPQEAIRAFGKAMQTVKIAAPVELPAALGLPGDVRIVLAESEEKALLRDVLESLGAEQDPDSERVADHLTRDVVFASPDWSLEEAAAAMLRGGLRHLVVLEQGETVGILSVRDVVRCWTEDGAICPVPASATTG